MKPLDPMNAPALRTLAGCRRRVRHMSLVQLWRLSYDLDVEPEDLARALYHQQRRQHAAVQPSASTTTPDDPGDDSGQGQRHPPTS